jgi:type 1 glutamine amidotransferase
MSRLLTGRMPLLVVVFGWLALVAASSTAAAEPAGAKAKSRVLIVTGFDVGVHKWKETTKQTQTILEKTGRYEVTVANGTKVFESPKLGDYDAILLNYGFWEEPEPSDQGKNNLLEYVKSGKGLVALHFACSSFQEWEEYGQLLGRVWKKGVGGHGPRGKFLVKIRKASHPITRGVKAFEADDELYAKLSGEAKIEVLASAHSDWSGQEEPMVFVKSYGKGRVVHNVLGHDVRARMNPSFQMLLVQGVDWAVGNK